jgi:hypothetical protein
MEFNKDLFNHFSSVEDVNSLEDSSLTIPASARQKEPGREVTITLTQYESLSVTEKAPDTTRAWTPGKGEWAAMCTIAVVSLIVALDATILVPALPVCNTSGEFRLKLTLVDAGC